MGTICVINDDHEPSTLLAELLAGRGNDTILSYDGVSGFDQIQTEHVDLIIVDVMTKKSEDRWDVLRFLRRHPYLRSLPVVVCAVVDSDGRLDQQCPREANVRVVGKPFDLEDLYSAVDLALERVVT